MLEEKEAELKEVDAKRNIVPVAQEKKTQKRRSKPVRTRSR